MRNVAIVLVIAAAAFFGWKKYQSGKTADPTAEVGKTTPDKTPGANAENRVNGLSGAAPVE
jgi:predicted negative regulator of RcsB-dependent stress response